MEIILPKNHPLYSFANEIKQICSPLHHYFDINTFSYVKIKPDLSRIHLETNPLWSEFFYKNSYRYHVKNGLTEGQHWCSGYSMLHMLNDYECIKDSREFNLGNGIVISNHNDNYTELVFFALPHEKNNLKLTTLLNNVDLLQKFLIYFKERAARILDEAEKQPIVLPFLQKKTEMGKFSFGSAVRQEFLNIVCDKSSVKNTLTKRELDCVYWSVQDTSAKQIAKILGISFRTVEKHLASAKNKLSCKGKASLARKFNSLFGN